MSEITFAALFDARCKETGHKRSYCRAIVLFVSKMKSSQLAEFTSGRSRGKRNVPLPQHQVRVARATGTNGSLKMPLIIEELSVSDDLRRIGSVAPIDE